VEYNKTPSVPGLPAPDQLHVQIPQSVTDVPF
jgi:hypothetical protein